MCYANGKIDPSSARASVLIAERERLSVRKAVIVRFAVSSCLMCSLHALSLTAASSDQVASVCGTNTSAVYRPLRRASSRMGTRCEVAHAIRTLEVSITRFIVELGRTSPVICIVLSLSCICYSPSSVHITLCKHPSARTHCGHTKLCRELLWTIADAHGTPERSRVGRRAVFGSLAAT